MIFKPRFAPRDKVLFQKMLRRVARKSSILCHTKLSRNHMTPELELALVTPECPAYREKPEKFPFQDPYWAFYWPGGQVLTKFILGKRSIIRHFMGNRKIVQISVEFF